MCPCGHDRRGRGPWEEKKFFGRVKSEDGPVTGTRAMPRSARKATKQTTNPKMDAPCNKVNHTQSEQKFTPR